MALRRIQKELTEIGKSPIPDMEVTLADEQDMFRWIVVIKGKSGTCMKGGIFKLLIEFSLDYPFKSPKIYHCNIGPDGEICLGLIKPESWKPSVRMNEVLLEIKELLYQPNPDDPLNTEAADLYKNDNKKYEKIVQEWTKKYATG